MPDRFDSTFRRSYPRLVDLAWRVLRDRAEAEDVAQETLARLADAAVLDRPDSEIDAWLSRVCLNRASNTLRGLLRSADRTDRSARLRPLGSPDDPAAEVAAADERARVRAVLTQLPHRQRSVLVLRHAGYSYAEIAAAVEVAPGSVGTLLARAERAFRTAYAEPWPAADVDRHPTYSTAPHTAPTVPAKDR